MQNETISGVELRHVPLLLCPFYAHHGDARPLKNDGLLRFNDDHEEYEHTDDGEHVAREIRAAHGMTWDPTIDGGGRWVVQGHGLHCGDALEILLSNGTWLHVRFEVTHSHDPRAKNGRVPVFYMALAGGGAFVCKLSVDTDRAVFRIPT